MNVSEPTLNLKGRPASARLHPLEHRSAIDASLADHERIEILAFQMVGVPQRAAHHHFQELRAAVVVELQQLQRFIHIATANEIGEQPNLTRAHVGESV